MVEGAMQASLDTGQPMSENVVSVEINEKFMSVRVSLAKIEVYGEVIHDYISPSHSEVLTKTPMINLDGIRVLAPFD